MLIVMYDNHSILQFLDEGCFSRGINGITLQVVYHTTAIMVDISFVLVIHNGRIVVVVVIAILQRRRWTANAAGSRKQSRLITFPFVGVAFDRSFHLQLFLIDNLDGKILGEG